MCYREMRNAIKEKKKTNGKRTRKNEAHGNSWRGQKEKIARRFFRISRARESCEKSFSPATWRVEPSFVENVVSYRH